LSLLSTARLPRSFAPPQVIFSPGNSRIPVDIAELKRKSVTELQDMADGLKISGSDVVTKPELIFRIAFAP